mgnify:CR=1 FL=1
MTDNEATGAKPAVLLTTCLLYTSDAADECVNV